MYHVILAGGSGTRFWPYSRKTKPKQLLKIIGDKSMINITIDRILQFSTIDKIYIVASKSLCELIYKEVPSIPKSNLIIEPEGRNTAPAIGLAAIHLYKKDPNAIMSIYPADQLIENQKGFADAILLAEKITNKNSSLITIGIVPTYPATGYGYIQYKNDDQEGYYHVKTFAEKPPIETAMKFIESGDFLWNAGIFVWKAKTILLEIKTLMPELHDSLSAIYDSIDTSDYNIVLKQEWQIIKSESIDYGILEKASNVCSIPGKFKWIDIGSWKSLFDLMKKDNDNYIDGNVISIDTKDSLIISPEKLTAVIGMKDVVIINVNDATLVMPISRSEEVKDIVNLLTKEKEKYL